VFSEISDGWIGLSDVAIEETYVWEDGTTGTYRNWDNDMGEPTADVGVEVYDCTKLGFGGFWSI